MKIVIQADVDIHALLACSSTLASGGIGYQQGGAYLAGALLALAMIGVAAAYKAGSEG